MRVKRAVGAPLTGCFIMRLESGMTSDFLTIQLNSGSACD